MKKYEVFTLSEKSVLKRKEKLVKDVERFLNEKANEGYEIVNVSFTENQVLGELVAFVTLCK